MSYRDSGISSTSVSSSSTTTREAASRCREYLVALAKTVALDLPEALGDTDGPSDASSGTAGARQTQTEKKNYYAALLQQLMSLGESQARLEKEIDTREVVMNETLRSLPALTSNASSSSTSSAPQPNETEMIKKVHKDVQAALATWDTSSAPVVRELEAILRPKAPRKSTGRAAEDAGDEEVQVVHVGGEREEDYICPYTKQRMVDPMKSTACKHRISRAGLNAMFARRPTARCVYPGCQAIWTSANSSLDADFAVEVERFYHKQQKKPRIGGSALRSQHDRGDEEYTNI